MKSPAIQLCVDKTTNGIGKKRNHSIGGNDESQPYAKRKQPLVDDQQIQESEDVNLRQSIITIKNNRTETPQPTRKNRDFPPWLCEFCPETCHTLGMKQAHQAQVHPSEFSRLKAKCWKCEFRFRSISGLAKHVEEAHTNKRKPIEERPSGIMCFICPGSVPYRDIRMHIRNRHPRAWDEKLTTKKLRKRYCPLCSSLIPAEVRSLISHIHIIHRELWRVRQTAEQMLRTQGPDPARRKWAICEVCKKRYVAGQLGKHMKLVHGPSKAVVEESAASGVKIDAEASTKQEATS